MAGTITLQGSPMDSMVAVGKDAKLCGDSVGVNDTATNGNPLANALVWVDGVSTGKPLPEKRRETLTIERCRFEPRVMAVVAKSTINVFSRDQVPHGPKFYREGAAEPIESIHTVDAGQVVPSEKIAAEPGFVEMRCAEHPFARAFIGDVTGFDEVHLEQLDRRHFGERQPPGIAFPQINLLQVLIEPLNRCGVCSTMPRFDCSQCRPRSRPSLPARSE